MYTPWSIASSAHEHESAHIAQIRPTGRFVFGRGLSRAQRERAQPRRGRFEQIVEACQAVGSNCGSQQRSQVARRCNDEQSGARSTSWSFASHHRSRRSGHALSDGYQAQNSRSARPFSSGTNHRVARASRTFGTARRRRHQKLIAPFRSMRRDVLASDLTRSAGLPRDPTCQYAGPSKVAAVSLTKECY